MRQSNAPFTRLACLAILTVLVFSGCRSGIFKKSETEWKRPDISGLAFWKKGDTKSVPPPPAHHFDPAPASSDMKTASTISTESIKSAARFKSATAEPELQNKFNQLVDAAKKEKGSAADAVAEISDLNAESKGKPIRSPYSLSDTKDSVASATSSAVKNAQNTFDPAGLKTQASAADETIEKAQSDFKAALANSSQSIKNSVSASSVAASELAKNEANDFKNDFQLPKKIEAAQNKIASAQNQFVASAQEVNHSLYDATGKLTNGVKDASRKTIDNLLKPSSGTVADDSLNAFDRSVTQSKQIAADVGATATRLSENDNELKKVRSEVQLAQQQIADLQAQIAAAKQATAAQSATAQQNAAVKNGILPAARASVNLNVPNAALNMAAQAVSPPMERVAQVNFNRSQSTPDSENFSPLQSSSANLSSTNSSPPANNRLRSGSQFAAGIDENNSISNSFAASATPSQGYRSDFQAPMRGDYAAQTVGGNTNASSATNRFDVQPVGLQSPISQSSTFNHVSEIDIPPAVLQGSGSYAPGSVNRLLPNK